MFPFKIFIPNHTDYLFTLRMAKAAEIDLKNLLTCVPPNFYNQDERYDEEVKKDCEKIKAADLDSVRIGMHIAAASICHQLLKEMLDNEKFFQSIGQLEKISETIDSHFEEDRHPKIFDYKEEAVEYFEEKLKSIRSEIDFVKKNILRYYPYQHLIDLAQQDYSKEVCSDDPHEQQSL